MNISPISLGLLSTSKEIAGRDRYYVDQQSNMPHLAILIARFLRVAHSIVPYSIKLMLCYQP